MRAHRANSSVIALSLAALVLAAAGCAQQKVRASVPVYSVPAGYLAEIERPMNAAPDTDAAPPIENEMAAPNPPSEALAEPVLPIPFRRPAPAPPRQVAEQPPAETPAEPAAHPPAPQISPQISAGDQAGYERRTNDDIALAEKNLQAASGRQLNAAQQDLVEKIHSFLAQSRDASRDADWARAQNLSQKARLLSIELVNSF